MTSKVLEEWHICLLDSSFQRESFDCGNENLNEWIKKYAGQNHRTGVAKTYVATRNQQSREVLGYYSISSGEISSLSLPEKMRKKLPRFPLGTVRVVKLAVDKSVQGRGLGKDLLFHAFHISLEWSNAVGIVAITVDPIDDTAKSFYLKYGFHEFEDNRRSLYIPISTVANLFK